MATNAFNDNAKPQNSVQGYHVHIYFEHGAPSEKLAEALAKRAGAQSGGKINETIRYNKLVGPHTKPNYALHIKPEGFAEIVGAMQLDSKGLSILIHPETSDEEKDHAERQMWIGKPVDLNMAFFTNPKAAGKGPKPQ
ncbi:MAG: DOPA 4,5-dioxygenase family protein [Alphaproteobacteria bacterium]|nr:DOPA 4,5-dioxygenase family protein [Alphaproteobacteria bacterium]